MARKYRRRKRVMSSTTVTYSGKKAKKSTSPKTVARKTKPLSGMDSRALKLGIRNGKTVEEFCLEHNCTAEEFDAAVKKLYPQDSSRAKIIRDLAKNSKKKDKKAAAAAASGSDSATDEAEIAAEIMPEAADESTSDVDAEQETAQAEATANTGATEEADNDLEKLRALEEESTERILAIENKHKAEFQKHAAHGKAIDGIYAQIGEIQKTLAELTEQYQQELAGARQCAVNMTAATAEWNAERAHRETIRSAIAKASKLTILVYSNGEFEEMNGRAIVTDGSDELYAELRDDPRFEEMRIKDIKILSKVLAAEKNLQNLMTVEFSFENSEVEIAYLDYHGD
jgi:hypothetical protein